LQLPGAINCSDYNSEESISFYEFFLYLLLLVLYHSIVNAKVIDVS